MQPVRTRFLLSLPERAVRSAVAVAGGTVHETAQLVLPRFVRGSRLYEATAKNLLRVAIELVGGVATPRGKEATGPGELALRKGAGNVVELGSIAAFGFSPLWLLAGASDLLHGSRLYLETLVEELQRGGLLAEEVEVESVDELLGVLERGAGRAAGLIDVRPSRSVSSGARSRSCGTRRTPSRAPRSSRRSSTRSGRPRRRRSDRCSRSRPASGSPSSTRRARSGENTSSRPTGRTGSRSAAKGSVPTRAGRPIPTVRRWRAISILPGGR